MTGNLLRYAKALQHDISECLEPARMRALARLSKIDCCPLAIISIPKWSGGHVYRILHIALPRSSRQETRCKQPGNGHAHKSDTHSNTDAVSRIRSLTLTCCIGIQIQRSPMHFDCIPTERAILTVRNTSPLLGLTFNRNSFYDVVTRPTQQPTLVSVAIPGN